MIGRGRPAAQRLDDLHAVEARHPEIQQHDVGMRLRGERDRRGAVGCGDDVVAVRGERDAQRADELRIVVGDEDLHRAASWRCRASGGCVGHRQRDDHGEPAARGVLRRERTAHALGEALREGETETEAGGVVGVAEALERGEHVVAPLGRDARAVVDDADLGDAAEAAGRDAHARARRASGARRWRGRSRARAAAAPDRPAAAGRSGSSARSTSSGPSAELVDGGEHDVGGVDRCERHREHAGLHAADVEQVGDERRQGGEALVGRREQLGRSSGESCAPAARRPPTAATAAASGRRRSWLTADRSARAHLVGLGEDAGFARGLGQLGVLERGPELGDDHVEEAALRGIQLAAVQLERRPRRALGSPTGSGSRGRRAPARRRWRAPCRRRRRAARRSCRTPRACGSRAPARRSRRAARCRRRWRAARPRRRRAGPSARAARGLVDDVAHEDRDDHVERRAPQRAADRRSSTVNSGATKRKSSVRPDSTAANSAGQMPPMSATMTTSSW